MKVSFRLISASVAATAALLAGTGAVFAAGATGSQAASDAPPVAVEDYVHPGSEHLLAERGFSSSRATGA